MARVCADLIVNKTFILMDASSISLDPALNATPFQRYERDLQREDFNRDAAQEQAGRLGQDL